MFTSLHPRLASSWATHRVLSNCSQIVIGPRRRYCEDWRLLPLMFSFLDLAAILLTVSALFGWLNHKFIPLPNSSRLPSRQGSREASSRTDGVFRLSFSRPG